MLHHTHETHRCVRGDGSPSLKLCYIEADVFTCGCYVVRMQDVATLDVFAGQPSELSATATPAGQPRQSVSAQDSKSARIMTTVATEPCGMASPPGTGSKDGAAVQALDITDNYGASQQSPRGCGPGSHVHWIGSTGRPPKPSDTGAVAQPGTKQRAMADRSRLSGSDNLESPEEHEAASSMLQDSPVEALASPALSYEQQDAEHVRVQFSSAAMQGIRSLPDALAPHFRERLFAELLAIGKLRHDRQQQQIRQHGGGNGRAGRHAAALAPLLAHGSKAGPLQVPVRSNGTSLCALTCCICLSDVTVVPVCDSCFCNRPVPMQSTSHESVICTRGPTACKLLAIIKFGLRVSCSMCCTRAATASCNVPERSHGHARHCLRMHLEQTSG